MSLPQYILETIEELIAPYQQRELKKARTDLTHKYRSHAAHYMETDQEVLSYLITRLPATYKVACKVFEELEKRYPETLFSSHLDLGSGPGTMALAFPTSSTTLVEKDPKLIQIGKKLVQSGTWLQADMTKAPLTPHDLVTFSYSLGELSNKKEMLHKAWTACRHSLILIEPGTPKGFQVILEARKTLLELGALIAAPCPHAHTCPYDWCHFSERLERQKIHKDLKGGTKGYEDEKYSYLIVSRFPPTPFQSRLIAPPEKHSGHIRLKLCTPEGIQDIILSRKDQELYRQAKKMELGDSYPSS